MEISGITSLASKISENIAKVIVGKNDVIKLVTTVLLAGGHVLLEDVPGTGKTVLAKSLARSVAGNFRRIQFTPDLLPSDVTGTSVFDQQKLEFEFKQGPAFTNILLADEINRATPRTQSALLECMEERQITADGETMPLPAPFFVIATQNPVEIQGTFPLPEAQLDRFLIKLSMGYPEGADAVTLIDRFIEASPLEEITSVATTEEILDAQRSFSKVHVSAPVREYIARLASETRKGADVSLGVSPRGVLAMLRAAQVAAAVEGRAYVLPDDVKMLAPHVFTHRMIMRGGLSMGAAKARERIEQILANTPAPTEDPSLTGMIEA